MKIVAHRGFWIEPAEKNSEQAFIRSAKRGYGIETDVRDCNGQLVIAHDVPQKDQALLSFDAFLQLYFENAESPGVLAINIKADGLQQLLLQSLQNYASAEYFVFDMSVPDTIHYKKLGIPFFSRLSEYEPQLSFADACTGIWLDAFEGTWYTTDAIGTWMQEGLQVCIVSPELHKRSHRSFWEELKKSGLHLNDNLLLCTDFPDDAKNFFQ